MSARSVNRFFSLLVLVALLLQPLAVTGKQGNEETRKQGVAAPAPETGLYRTTVTVDSPSRRARLEALGVVVLTTDDGRPTTAVNGLPSTVVLADADQLEALARLRFEPRATDDADALVAAHAIAQPALAAAWGAMRQRMAANAQMVGAAALVSLSTPALSTALAGLTSIDDDADGLTNTEEAWWCTDPMNPDTDADGRSDGAEVQALKDWMANRRAGPPGETPWPSWPFNATTCADKDHDSIPNMAERWELGLNMDLESTDRDKFDDGQELFGVTNCPGGDLSCGYGDLPRSSDSGYVGATMPSWVKAPGNHPLVAAFPVPEVDVVESSLHVQTVTTVEAGHTIGSGTEKSYSTAKTEGTSSSLSDTVMWNEWEEVTLTTPVTHSALSRSAAVLLVPEDGPVKSFTPWEHLGKSVVAFGGAWGGVLAACGALGLPSGGVSCLPAAVLGLGAIGYSVWEAAGALQELKEQREGGASCTSAGGAAQLSVTAAQTTGAGLTCVPKTPVSLYRTGSPASINGVSVSTQDAGAPGTGIQIQHSADTQLTTASMYQGLTYPSLTPLPTRSDSSGHSWGGSRTTSSSQYEEHTITNGEAFSTNDSWGTATAVNSAYAADLWFTYKVRNAGTEYARQIQHLAFNIYIGDNPNPACTYHVGSTACGVPVDTVLFSNFMPGEEHSYTSFRVPLTLEQMKAVDLGGPVRVVVEDFDYGADELFYQDAAGASVRLAIEDGTADGDESIDNYLIPTWGTETVLDVLGRYFPHTTDENGMLIAVWTPEYRADTPTWCAEPKVVGIGSQRTLWCKHALSTADWWNVYTNGMGDGSEGFQDTPAARGQTALFRFNSDSDLDGYSDRSELRLGTDPNDPASYPRPELLAGLHNIRLGNTVTATLSLLNTGLYDAYGVEAVMIAPNDTISITNNTVGGSGRVRAQKQVIVGSRIVPQTPLPAAWLAAGHAQPTASGYYTGTKDLTYTFTVGCANAGGCAVGTDAWTLAWNDGKGANGSLPFDSTYKSPTLRGVGAYGLQLGFLSGKVNNGESFTVAANTPRDTFQYTIAAGHESDYTPPVVLVSYNDPQGNHRLAIPPAAMSLFSPTADLLAFSGQMLPEPGVEIVTGAPFATGANTTDLVVNNPTETTLTNAHLFLEFIDPDGNVVLEAPATSDLPAGPTVVSVAWNSGSFNPAYDPAKDYIVMAFLTDYQGNILDTAARPLSSFQEDPKPEVAMAAADETWDFGTAQQGSLLQRAFTLGSVGYGDLLTYLGTTSGLAVIGSTARSLAPGDTATYTVTLQTQALDVGEFDKEIKVRTSDPAHPEKKITIQGTVTAMPPDAPGGVTIQPLDVAVPVTGNQGDWVEFTHTLGPDAQTLHPVKVWSQDYQKIWGAGKYATAFVSGSAPSDMFGSGQDGNLVVGSGQTYYTDSSRTTVVGTAAAKQPVISVASTVGFAITDEVLIIQMQGSNAGAYEYAKIRAVGTNSLTLDRDLRGVYNPPPTVTLYELSNYGGRSETFTADDPCLSDNIIGNDAASSIHMSGYYVALYADCNYQNGDWFAMDYLDLGARGWDNRVSSIKVFPATSFPNRAQVIRVPQYRDVTVLSGGVLTAHAWDGASGGVLAFRASGLVDVQSGGTISLSAKGYRGGNGGPQPTQNPSEPGGEVGEGFIGGFGWPYGPYDNRQGPGTGGGARLVSDSPPATNNGRHGGGGGGHAYQGQQLPAFYGASGGDGGLPYSSDDLARIYLGAGGGGGGGATGYYGGRGGGIAIINAHAISAAGAITSDGQAGANGPNYNAAAGGGGAGGSILITMQSGTLGTNKISSAGGSGGASGGWNSQAGGSGSVGYVRTEYCENPDIFSTNPPASTKKLNCYIADQATDPTHGLLNLPATGANTYQVQYGRRYVFTDTLQSTQSIRMPKQLYTTAALDVLVSNTGAASGPLILSLDVGGDGTPEWTYNNTTTFPISFTVSSLASALNAYMVSQTGVAWNANVNVPMKLTINRQADVILTNLVLTLQSNQPGTLAAAAVEIGVDRPLDVPVVITGTHLTGFQFPDGLGGKMGT